MGSYPGLPDRVMHYNGEVVYLEIKTLRGRLSPAQDNFLVECAEDGIEYWVIQSLEDLISRLGDSV